MADARVNAISISEYVYSVEELGNVEMYSRASSNSNGVWKILIPVRDSNSALFDQISPLSEVRKILHAVLCAESKCKTSLRLSGPMPMIASISG